MTAARMLILMGAAGIVAHAALLTPETIQTFDSYVRRIEMQMEREPLQWQREDVAHVRNGDLVVLSKRAAGEQPDTKIPGGEIHDWTGLVFIPKAAIATACSVMQDYSNYRKMYAPDVIDSRLISHYGDEFHVFLRLHAKHIITVVYNTEYDIVYAQPDAADLAIRSRSARIAQVLDPDRSMTAEHPVGDDDGFLWRINAYWRFHEADGGLYAECRAVSLSRALPFGFGWLRAFIEQFPKQSMMNALAATKRAITLRAAGGC